MKIRCLVVPALLCAALFVGACQSESKTAPSSAAPKASMGAMNTKCPMTGEDVDKSSPTADYKGQKVAFCCNGCAGKFAKLSDADKAAKLAKAK